jgi:hypothetical protein
VRDLVASAGLLIGAEGVAGVARADSVGVAVLGGVVVGEGVGAAAGDLALASGLAGGRAGILFGIGHRIGIARGGTTGILLTSIRIRTRLSGEPRQRPSQPRAAVPTFAFHAQPRRLCLRGYFSNKYYAAAVWLGDLCRHSETAWIATGVANMAAVKSKSPATEWRKNGMPAS